MAETHVRRTQAQAEAEVARLGRHIMILVGPGETTIGPNATLVPGTEQLHMMVELAAAGYIAQYPNQVAHLTPEQRKQASPAYNRMVKAIQKAQQEGRFQ